MSQDHTSGAIYIAEEDVVRLLPMTDAIEAVELAFRHLGAGGAVNRPRERIAFSGGSFNFMAGADQTQGLPGLQSLRRFPRAPRRHDGHALQHRERALAGDHGGQTGWAKSAPAPPAGSLRGSWRVSGRQWSASLGPAIRV